MSLSHLILGLLHRKPDSGYDLNKRFENTVAHFWSTDRSQIYRTLYKLHNKDWVDVEVVIQEGKPDKKVYSITASGQGELMNWLQKPLWDELVIRDAETGQVFFGDIIGAEKFIQVQQQYIQQIHDKVQTYHAIEQAFFAPPDFDNYPLDSELARATLQYGIQALELEIDWREQLIQSIQQRQQREANKGG